MAAGLALDKLPLPQPTHEELAGLVGFAVERVA
jgi:hypothetical protein